MHKTETYGDTNINVGRSANICVGRSVIETPTCELLEQEVSV